MLHFTLTRSYIDSSTVNATFVGQKGEFWVFDGCSRQMGKPKCRIIKAGVNSLAPASRRRYGFTLIELLVLVSIIALLVAILLPALSLAKHLAYEARCAHNLHQVNIGFVIYADQYDGRYPLEDTEHNPHPDLITILPADSPGLIDVFYCPQALYMETFAQDTLNYIPYA